MRLFLIIFFLLLNSLLFGYCVVTHSLIAACFVGFGILLNFSALVLYERVMRG